MNITVLGSAKSGFAAAKLAKNLSNNVFVSELSDELKYNNEIEYYDKNSIKYEFGKNSMDALHNCDLIISSPGVPPSAEIIKNAMGKNIPIISELEYAWQHRKGNKSVAITGTNGKTTTTSLINFIFQHSGRKSVECGNIGTPLSEIVLGLNGDEILVIEASSYQLDRVDRFKPDVALMLNLSPDHLKYHGNYQQYIEAKWKISKNQNQENLLILNCDDSELGGTSVKDASKSNLNFKTQSNINYFSTVAECKGAYSQNGTIIFNDIWEIYNRKSTGIKEELMLTNQLSLPGTHNLYNSMAAAIAVRSFELRNEDIRDALMQFSGVEHRLEFVKEINNVRYINDSKATNINATWYALSSYDRPLVWIAGGQSTGNDYSELDDLVKENVKTIVAIGDDAENVFNHFSSIVRCLKANSMGEAVSLSKSIAIENDIVLFSPSCKSFDWFANYEHRGKVFKECVENEANNSKK